MSALDRYVDITERTYEEVAAATAQLELADKELADDRRQAMAWRDQALRDASETATTDVPAATQYSHAVWDFAREVGYPDSYHATGKVVLKNKFDRPGMDGVRIVARLTREGTMPYNNPADHWRLVIGSIDASQYERSMFDCCYTTDGEKVVVEPGVLGDEKDLPGLLEATWGAVCDDTLNPDLVSPKYIRGIQRQEESWSISGAISFPED